MKSALFVQANVAVNTKLTSKVPFLFGNFQVFKKKFGQKRAILVWYDGKNFLPPPPPRRQHFRENFFRCPLQYPNVPLEAGAPPQSFDASYAPALFNVVFDQSISGIFWAVKSVDKLIKAHCLPPD